MGKTPFGLERKIGLPFGLEGRIIGSPGNSWPSNHQFLKNKWVNLVKKSGIKLK